MIKFMCQMYRQHECVYFAREQLRELWQLLPDRIATITPTLGGVKSISGNVDMLQIIMMMIAALSCFFLKNCRIRITM